MNRGKQSLVLDLKTPEAIAVFEELVRGRRRRDRGDAARASCKMGLGYDRLKELNPKIVMCTISGLRRHRPVPDLPSHGIAYDAWAGTSSPCVDDDGFTRIPDQANIGITAGPAFGAIGILAALVRAEKTGEGANMEIAQSDAAAYFDWYRIETWKGYDDYPDDVVTGNPSDDYERRPPGLGGMWEGVRYQYYESSDGHILFMASEQSFWKNFCEGVDRMDLFEKWPGKTIADHARGNKELQTELRDIFRTRTLAGVDRLRRRAQHHDRAGQHARRPCVDDPQFQDRFKWTTSEQTRRRQLLFPLHVEGEKLPVPDQGARGRRAHRRRCCATCSATTTPRSRRSVMPAPSAESMSDQRSGPLRGIRVLDFSIALTGPLRGRAHRRPGRRRGEGRAARHRRPRPLGRRGRQRHERALLHLQPREAVDRASTSTSRRASRSCCSWRREADVIVQNYRPGVMDRLGLGYDAVRALNPDIVYASLTGFGSEGPYRDRSAYDTVIQAYGGFAVNQADPTDGGVPVFLRQTAADKVTALYASQAITAALFARASGDGGQHVELSMADAVVSFLWADSAGNEVLLDADGSQNSSLRRRLPADALRGRVGDRHAHLRRRLPGHVQGPRRRRMGRPARRDHDAAASSTATSWSRSWTWSTPTRRTSRRPRPRSGSRRSGCRSR